jgi:hypothetical protein
MTTLVRVRKTMLEALLALALNATLGGVLFAATHQTWLLPSQANCLNLLVVIPRRQTI